MHQLIGRDQGQYSFNPGAGTITISGLNNGVVFGDEQLLLINNARSNVPLFNFAIPALAVATCINNVITLPTALTSAMNATDPLQIYLDLPSTAPADTAAAVDTFLHLLLRQIVDNTECLSTQDSSQRLRVTIDALTAGLTLTTVGTVGSLTGGSLTTLGTVTNPVPVGNVATIGGGNPEWQNIDLARAAYNSLRSQITFGN